MDFALNIESKFSPMLLRRVNTWYSVKDGNWSDPNTWMSNALDKKLTLSPQPGDNVYVNHTVTCDVNSTVNNLYGNGYLSVSTNIVLTVNGDVQITGTVDQTAANSNLILNGYVNIILSYSAASSSTMTYNGRYQQNILNLSYGALTVSNIGKKFLISDLTTSGLLTVSSFLETGTYNCTINGATNISGTGSTNLGTLSKTGSGSLLFVGAFTISNNNSGVVFSGNPTIEMRGGLTLKNDSFSLNLGTGTLNFTTNNQTLALGNGTSPGGNVSVYPHLTPLTVNIVGAITLTSTAQWLAVDGVINGTVSGSTLLNTGYLLFNNSTTSMSTGTFNYSTSGNVVGYIYNGSYTLPYNNYQGLLIEGTGTKTLPAVASPFVNLYLGIKQTGGTVNLSADATISGFVYLNQGKLEASTYNINISGTTSLNNAASIFSKTGSGSVVFAGLYNHAIGASTISLTGNPTIEFQNGVTMAVDGIFNWGTGNISFTTRNQTISTSARVYPDSSFKTTLSNNITVSGAITVTYSALLWILTGTLNGTVAGSTFVNTGYLQYQNAQQPMQTGVLTSNGVSSNNYFEYGLAGNQDITPGTYYNLNLSGSGAKKLLGNVSVTHTYTLSGSATLNSNGFSLTNP